MADSRIEEVQAKVTELQTQYDKLLRELVSAMAAYGRDSSDENASKLATAQKAEGEAKVNDAKKQAEEAKNLQNKKSSLGKALKK